MGYCLKKISGRHGYEISKNLETGIVSALVMTLIVFVCISGGALLGMFLRSRLPAHHLSSDAKDVVRLGTGLIGTIAALVLGLLISSAKDSFDTKNSQIKQLTANIILLDGLLAQYGAEARATREQMRPAIITMTERIWRQNVSHLGNAAPFEASHASEAFVEMLQELSPKNEAQRSLKDRAIQTITEIAKTRFLLFAQADNSIPMPFLAVLVFWLTIIFVSFSLFTKPNAIIVGSLFIFALSAASAIFLILELGQPFDGLMQISSTPLLNALAPLGP
jgi:hypothetical protein